MVKIIRQAKAPSALILLLIGLAVPVSSSAQDLPNLNGVWAQKQVHASVSTLPVLGKVQSSTTSTLHIRIRQSGEHLKVSITPCEVKIDTDTKTVRTLIPQGFIEALGTTQANAKLVYENDKWIFDQAPAVSVSGAVLSNPWRDPLPDAPADPAVFDADNDGNPGVSIHVRGLVDGSIYLVQRSWNALKGEVKGARIEGLVRWQTSQRILGASSFLLKSEPKTSPHSDASKSNFISVRIDDSAQCADILREPGLFK